MPLAAIVILALKLSVILLVFTVGMKSDPGQLAFLLRRPALLARSLLSMNVIMPLAALGLGLALPVSHVVKVVLVAVALSPMPPLLPGKHVKAGGNADYSIGLLFAAALFAIIAIPVAVEVLERVLNVPLEMSAVAVAKVVLITVLAPLGAGLALRAALPALAGNIAQPISKGATIVLLVGLGLLILATRKEIAAELTVSSLAAIAAFIAIGLVVGHRLGGPDQADRTVLAFSTASRHPGMALAIASANFPEKRAFLAALLIYLILGAVLSAVYLALRKRAGALPTASAAPS